MILFNVEDVMAIYIKRNLIVMQSIYIAEKRKEKAKWFILEKLREKNLQKIYFRRDI